MERADIDGRVGGFAVGGEDLDGNLDPLLAPPADLMGVVLAALGGLDECSVAIQRGDRHVAVKAGE